MHRTQTRQQKQRPVGKCHREDKDSCTDWVLDTDTGRDVQCNWVVTSVEITFQPNGYPI